MSLITKPINFHLWKRWNCNF